MADSATHFDRVGPVDLLAKPQAWAVGPWEPREFASACCEIAAAKDWPRVTSIDAACEILSDNEQPPELILLAQPLPGLYRQADIDRLQQLAPLTRLVIVVGTWCEGELRTGTPPAGVIRLYWHELASWWQAALRRHNAGLCPLWSLPLDHPQAGRWSPSENSPPVVTPTLSVLIDANDYSTYEALAAALQQFEVKSTWKDRDQEGPQAFPATAGVWDGGQLSERELQQLTAFCRQVTGPVIALLDFPRVEHFSQAKAAGASAVFAKPYVVEEVVAALSTRQVGASN